MSHRGEQSGAIMRTPATLYLMPRTASTQTWAVFVDDEDDVALLNAAQDIRQGAFTHPVDAPAFGTVLKQVNHGAEVIAEVHGVASDEDVAGEYGRRSTNSGG